MPVIRCPAPNCSYVTDDVSEALAIPLLTIHATCHAVPAAPTTATTAKVEKVKRPSISSAGTSEEWSYFLVRWNEYVAATHITGTDKIIQLLECCEEPLRKDLTRSVGGSLSSKTEADILAAMKKLAVREENPMVARVILHDMRQDREESIRSFGARIRGQAGVCKYTVECPTCKKDVDYTECILRDVLSRGLADPEIQLDLLGDPNQDMTLEEVFKYVESKEAGKRSALRLQDSQGANATKSSYRRSQQPSVPTHPPGTQEVCSYCGKSGHGTRAPPHIRQSKCPAYSHTCSHCRRDHHFDSVCRNKNKPKFSPSHRPHGASKTSACSSDEGSMLYGCEGAVFDSLCSLQSSSQLHMRKPLSLDHHLYDNLLDRWIRQTSKPQPYIQVTASICPEDYTALGFDCPVPANSTNLSVMADTGCQSCLASVKALRSLGISSQKLIPVRMKMHAANNEGIQILGAVILRFSGVSNSGLTLSSRQLVYVTNSCDKIFLSREACADLGLISSQFPKVGESAPVPQMHISPDTELTSTNAPIHEHPPSHSQDIALYASTDLAPCGCPRRETPPPKPTALPFPPTPSNRGKLQSWLADYYKGSSFNMCKHQPLNMMDCPPMELMVDRDATPVAYHTPLPVPLHWQDEVKAALDEDVALGVLELVPVGEPVTWCHRMVVCPKKDGKPRRTVDLQALNAHATRETHHTQSPFHQARLVPHNTKKTVLDAWNGYHSVPLREEDRHLTTFITPWGRYRYRVAPQGYVSSGDGYTRRYDEIVANIPNKTKCIDDALLWSDNIEESFWQAVEWLNLCGQHGITFNLSKFVFAADEVEFAGFDITRDSVRPCQKYLQAIRDFPTPRNITDVRSWFGLINQVSYAFSMAETMLPFRQLLQPGTPFRWTDEINATFEESKGVIIAAIKDGVQIYDKKKPTCLTTDWCKSGIGFWLLQKHCDCVGERPFCCIDGWKIALVGSRFTTPAESRYAPVEGEALAVAEALDRARFFVLGCQNLIVAVDHKPLLKIMGNRSLDQIPNSRLRNLKERTLRYSFRVIHVPGAKHRATDALSRHPAGDPNPEQPLEPDDIYAITQDTTGLPALTIFQTLLCGIRVAEEPVDNTLDVGLQQSAIHALSLVRAVTWDRVRLATASDSQLHQLISFIEDGMPESRHSLPPYLRPFHEFRNGLYTVDGVIIYNGRVVIPASLREEVLEALHGAHHGVTAMTARAESSVFWPGITTAIASTRTHCGHCNRMAPSQPSAPPINPILPVYPFQCVCADFFTLKGSNYLVIVDRYSNWPIIEKSTEGSKGLINCLRRTFATYGIPDELSSDGGSEFTSQATQQFLSNWGVRHRLSSVAYPHSNCRAEVGVKSAKRMLTDHTGPHGELDTDAVQRAMLQYRNTPDASTKLSPAMCVFGRPIRDFIPILPGRYQPHNTWQETLAAREEALRNRHMRAAERWSEHTRRLPPLVVGDHVRIQNQVGNHPLKWDKTGVVVEVRQHDQYIVRVDGSGRATLRNRKFLRKYIPYSRPSPRLSLQDDLQFLKTRPVIAPVPSPAPQLPKPPHSRPVAAHTLPSPAPQLTVPTPPLPGPVAAAPNLPGPAPQPNVPAPQPSRPALTPGPHATYHPADGPATIPLEGRTGNGPPSMGQTTRAQQSSRPRMLSRLLPHNQPGLKEAPAPSAAPSPQPQSNLRRSPRNSEYTLNSMN